MDFIDIRDICRVRNFYIACIKQLAGEERKSLFTWFCSNWKSQEKRIAMISNHTHSFHDETRYRFVMSEASRLSKNTTEITKKTRMCTRGKHDKESCTFAHSDEEWVPPYCLYQEFCNSHDCDKNHGLSSDEYRLLHDIAPSPAPTPYSEKMALVNTKFCQSMKENEPCANAKCTFCHSVSTFVPYKCKFEFCNNPKCTYKHSWDSMETYMKKQGIVVEAWHSRPEKLNNWVEANRRETFAWMEAYTAEIIRLEENDWKDEKDEEKEIFEKFEKMSIEENETTFTIFGKDSFSLSQCV